MKKVLIITYYWPPSGGAGVQRMLKFVKYFPEFKVEPLILTVDENKASYQLIDNSLKNDIPTNIKIFKTSTFEPFGFYKILGKKKEIPHSGFANESNPSIFQKLMRFIRGNFFIPDARVGWNQYAYKMAVKIIENETIDAVITSSPPHSTQLIGLKLKNKYKIKWIADLRDPWTDIYYYKQMYHTKLAETIDKKYEKKVLENSDAIIVVSKNIKEIFKSKTETDIDNKIHIIPNGYDEDDFDRVINFESDEFMITYTGTYADIYQIDGFLNAFKKFILEFQNSNIKLRFIGKISDTLPEKITNLKLNNYVEFNDYLPHKDSVKELLKSSALLLIIPKMEKNEGILTGKLFEYLGSYKPIICLGPLNGDAAKIINQCNAGEVFDYENSNNIFDYLRKIYLNRNNIVCNYLEINKYTRKNLTKKLTEIINN